MAHMTLYCFPHAGGSDALYRSWAGALAAEAEVRVLGRGPWAGAAADGPPDDGTVPGLAAACADRLAGAAGPYAFLGHSLGALIAFETARELARRGAAGPHTLIASGHVAPHLPSPGRRLAELPYEAFWHEVGLLGGTPAELADHAELRRAAEPWLRAEFRAAEGYRYTPGVPLDCRVVALAGTEDDRAPAALVEPWRLHTVGAFERDVLPGGHFFPADSRERFLACVRARLAAVPQR
ncbi:thioesterase domain-containing protein [Streptomyces sp.]|uniref:thioesterase II family protein n=1 Tax=Streptomyces sp. TaxID=1931 RepID=UPI002811755D|nr:thioesterase domain-containing protein [Streptomyces sp.]